MARSLKKIMNNGAMYALLTLASVFSISSCKAKEAPKIQGMAYVEPGKFHMGSKGTIAREGFDEGDGQIGIEMGVDEIPRHKALVEKGFYMDIYEVTMGQYKKFIDATGRPVPENPNHPDDPYIWKNKTYPQGMEDNPVALVSYEDATEYCKWVGKRLPTEIEWEKACRGESARRWPWGDNIDIGKANTRNLDLRRSSPVGGFPEDVSPYGIYDMAGNIREWTTSWYKPYPGAELKRETFGETYKVVRGGSWVHTAMPESRCASRGMAQTWYRHRSLGLRCVKDAE